MPLTTQAPLVKLDPQATTLGPNSRTRIIAISAVQGEVA